MDKVIVGTVLVLAMVALAAAQVAIWMPRRPKRTPDEEADYEQEDT